MSRSVITPEEDYSLWESQLIAYKENATQYRQLLNKVSKMVSQIKMNDQLNQPLSDKTVHFLDTNLPAVIKNLVSQKSWQSDQSLVINILSTSCLIIGKVIRKCSIQAINEYISLFNPTHRFYFDSDEFPETGGIKKYKKLNKWKEITTDFVDHKGMDKLYSFVEKNPENIQVGVFCFIFMLLIIYGRNFFNNEQKYFQLFLNEYLVILSNTNNKQGSNNSRNEIKFSLHFFMALSEDHKTFFTPFIEKIVKIALDNLKTENLEKNLSSVLILKEIITSDRTYDIDTNEVIKMLLDKDLHQSIIPDLKPIFLSLAEQGELQNEIVKLLWTKTKNAHFSQQGMYADILGSIMIKLDPDILEEIKSIIMYSDPVEQVAFKVLLQYCAELSNTDISKCNEILDQIFQMLHDPNNTNIILNCFEQQKSKKLFAYSLTLATKRFNENPSKELANLLIVLIRRNKSEISTSRIFEMIPLFKKAPKDVPIFPVISKLILMQQNFALSTDRFDQLFDIGGDELWILLNDLLKQKGAKALEKDCGKHIINRLTNYDVTVTPNYISFLRNLIILVGIKQKTIISQTQALNAIPKKFQIQSLDTPGLKLLFKKFEREQYDFDSTGSTSNNIASTLLELLGDLYAQEIPKLLNIFQKHIEEATNKIKENFSKQQPINDYLNFREKYFKLLQHFMLNYEDDLSLVDEGYARHKDIVIPAKDRYILFVNIKGTNKTKPVFID